MKKTNYLFSIAAIALCGIVAYGEIKDDAGAALNDDSPFYEINGKKTTIGDFKDYIAPNYANVSNKAENAVQATEVTNVVIQVSSSMNHYVWDSKTGVCYYIDPYNDFLRLYAITNVDVNLPANSEARSACDAIVETLHND